MYVQKEKKGNKPCPLGRTNPHPKEGSSEFLRLNHVCRESDLRKNLLQHAFSAVYRNPLGKRREGW
jgi:hypothetical protein